MLTPYQPVIREQLVRYFEHCGFTVVRYKDLGCASAKAIAPVTESELETVINELNGPDVDAVVQCGTNLSMVRLAANAEVALKKPIIAINTAIVWHAYRAMGFNERLFGFGRLLSEF